MSAAVQVIVSLLKTNSDLIAVVAAAKIMPGAIPAKTALPAIGITHVSTIRKHMVAATATEFCTSRIQITAHAVDYPQQQQVLALVRAALPRTRGAVAGVNVDNILHELDGPDFRDEDVQSYIGSVDYIVTFNE